MTEEALQLYSDAVGFAKKGRTGEVHKLMEKLVKELNKPPPVKPKGKDDVEEPAKTPPVEPLPVVPAEPLPTDYVEGTGQTMQINQLFKDNPEIKKFYEKNPDKLGEAIGKPESYNRTNVNVYNFAKTYQQFRGGALGDYEAKQGIEALQKVYDENKPESKPASGEAGPTEGEAGPAEGEAESKPILQTVDLKDLSKKVKASIKKLKEGYDPKGLTLDDDGKLYIAENERDFPDLILIDQIIKDGNLDTQLNRDLGIIQQRVKAKFGKAPNTYFKAADFKNISEDVKRRYLANALENGAPKKKINA